MKFRLVEEYKKLIAYNRSDKKFDKFSDSTKGETIGTDEFDIPGIYFSNDKEFARGYACGKSYSVNDDGTINKSRQAHKGYLYTCELNYNKPIIIDYKKEDNKEAWDLRDKVAKNLKQYKAKGYDIVLILNFPYLTSDSEEDTNIRTTYGNEYVVLNPNIIKILDTEECESTGVRK